MEEGLGMEWKEGGKSFCYMPARVCFELCECIANKNKLNFKKEMSAHIHVASSH